MIDVDNDAVADDDDDNDNHSDDDFVDGGDSNENQFSRWSSMLKKEEYGAGSFQ